jgi:hypothetical protein
VILHEISRRRLLIAAGALAATQGWAQSALAAEGTPSPPVGTSTPAEVDRFIALSRTLCGGGRFDPDAAAQLLGWLNDDPGLRRGLAELLTNPSAASATIAALPAAGDVARDAESAAEAILLFWYVGYFKGNPVPDRGLVYGELVAWQAMYTLPFAECKEFGGWSQAPNTEPAVLGL